MHCLPYEADAGSVQGWREFGSRAGAQLEYSSAASTRVDDTYLCPGVVQRGK